MKTAKSHHSNVETHYPEAFLTINRNRLKIYHDNSIFLNHGDEFEVEFNNITRTVWLARIKMNGEWTTEAGLVLRPGEHVFLDTPSFFSNNKRRFCFKTYDVKTNRSHLIEENGIIEIFFHKKEQPNPVWINDYDVYYDPPRKRYPRPPWPLYPRIWYPTHPWYPITRTGADYIGNDIFTNSYNTVGQSNFNENPCGEIPLDNMEETGRIENGSKSKQKFVDTNENFESDSSHEITYKIFPASKKPKTIQEVKQYCSECGRRRRKNEKYCSQDGTKF